jgi:hypothetical protein
MALSALILSGYRLLLRSYFLLRQRSGIYAKNVILLGQHLALDWMIRYFESYVSPTEYRLLGQLCPEGEEAADLNILRLGAIADLGDLLIHHPIHEVIAIQPLTNGTWIERVIQACDYGSTPAHCAGSTAARSTHIKNTLSQCTAELACDCPDPTVGTRMHCL